MLADERIAFEEDVYADAEAHAHAALHDAEEYEYVLAEEEDAALAAAEHEAEHEDYIFAAEEEAEAAYEDELIGETLAADVAATDLDSVLYVEDAEATAHAAEHEAEAVAEYAEESEVAAATEAAEADEVAIELDDDIELEAAEVGHDFAVAEEPVVFERSLFVDDDAIEIDAAEFLDALL